MEEKRLVLLDFDGTIADTFHIGHSVAQKICVYITATEYRRYHEGNIHEEIAAVRAADHGDRCDHALDWIGSYLPPFKTHAHPFTGMPEVLDEFSKTYALFVVSSTQDEAIEYFLQKYDLQRFIEGVYGMQVSLRKDEKFRSIFSKYGVAPKDCLFITDTLGDINEASTVGLSSIGVTWGFQDHVTLARGNPFAIVDSPQELPAAVEKYFRSA